jgi:hypothetical protein
MTARRRLGSAGVDPELTRQLAAAAATQSAVQVVFFLKSATMPVRGRAPVPDETRATARELLARVEAKTGEKALDWHVFESLGSFVVQASPRLLEELLGQAEIASATVNRRGSD